MLKKKRKTRKKPTAQSLAVAVRKTQSKLAQWQPPPPPPSYQYPASPEFDPKTRHALVDLAQKVTEFENVADRVRQLGLQVTKAENRINETPDQWWHHLQFAISTLQEEFRKRVPTLERNYENMELLAARMERLEKQFEELAKAVLQPERTA
jgi:DNA repair ATPase RecN